MLRTAQEVPAGTQVQCPHCRGVFAAPDLEPAPPPARNVPAVPACPAPRLVNESWEDANRPGPRPQARGSEAGRPIVTPRYRPPPSSKAGLVIGLSLGGGAVVVLLILMLIFLGRGSSLEQQLIGRWELVEINGRFPNLQQTWEFHGNGRGTCLEPNNGDPERARVHFDYHFLNRDTLEVVSFNRFGPNHRTFQVTMQSNNELRLIGMGEILLLHRQR